MSRDHCVLIHGFTGNPAEVLPLAEALEKREYDVKVPLLPGHNHTKDRMRKVTASEWIDAVAGVIEESHSSQRLHLVGFSMGAMIAVLMTMRYNVSTLVLLSPAVYTITPNVIATRTRKTIQLIQQNPELLKRRFHNNMTSIWATPLYNVFQFQKIVREARKVVCQLDLPICIIHGLEDEIVDPASARWIYETVLSTQKEIHLLTSSGHLVCHDGQADVLIQTVTQFLDKHS